MELKFSNDTATTLTEAELWPALVMPAERIDQEIARLASIALPDDGRRRSMIVHPSSSPDQPSLAPAIDVALNVLLPGEKTQWRCTNAAQVVFCIAGTGMCEADQTRMNAGRFDTWTIPSMAIYRHENTGKQPFVFLSYSNAALLMKLRTYFEELNPARAQDKTARSQGAPATRARDAALDIAIGNDGARILGYEYLVDIDVVPSPPLHWPWSDVSAHLGKVEHLGGERGKGYDGRHLVTLYNPATGRRIGTTPSFFASIAQFPAGRVDIPHRHSSAAINYIFAGSGRSSVSGRKFEWKAGDIMLSAPGWAIHNHTSGSEGCNILTVQDHPLHIAAESLLWQETLKGPVMKLGAEIGVQTNIENLSEA